MFAYLLLVLSDGPEVGLHVSTLGLQGDHLVDDDVGIGDFFQLGRGENRKLLCGLALDRMKGQLGGLGNNIQDQYSTHTKYFFQPDNK